MSSPEENGDPTASTNGAPTPSAVTLANITDVDWIALVQSPEPLLNIETVSRNLSANGEPIILKLGPSPRQGLGLFTTHSIAKGTTILSEPPLFATYTYPQTAQDIYFAPTGVGPNKARLYMSLYADYNNNASQSSSESSNAVYSPLLYMLPLHSWDQNRHLLQIFKTNCFTLSTSAQGIEELGIFGLGSRFNHACSHSFRSENPNNVVWKWDGEKREMVFTMMCGVEEGEELRIDYGLGESETRVMLGEACPICKYYRR